MLETRQQLVLEEKDGCQTDLLQTIAAYSVVLGKLKKCAQCAPINELHARTVSCSTRSHRSGEAEKEVVVRA